jgi:hypothetical protein
VNATPSLARILPGERTVAFALILATAVIYYHSNPQPGSHYDYTFRIAGALLEGRLGLVETPPPWLNEMVPFEGRYYSVFPLGSVLTMLPLTVLQPVQIGTFPAAAVSALVAAAITGVCFLLARGYDLPAYRRAALSVFIAFGSWTWTNLAFAGAWQIALGFGLLGQLAAIYFTLAHRIPLVAGFFFALAFGNRTEIILTAPVFFYVLCRGTVPVASGVRQCWRDIALFSLLPFLLGILTLGYNYARFDSILDFGYARIPGVLDEPWYRHGIFSIRAIPLNATEMLLTPWRRIEGYPYLVPTGFGGSIFLASPFLFLVFQRGARNTDVKRAAWIATAILTLVLWCHGNPGGWQYSYRYAMVLLPWLFIVLLENSHRRPPALEFALLVASIGVSTVATYLFYWTSYVRP